MPDIVVIGEALVDLFAEPGTTLGEAPAFTPRFGGAPANVAVAAARLGASAGFVGKVGRDGFGDALHAALAGYGVDVTHLTRSPRPTMLACVALPTPDSPDFVLFDGANDDLSASDVDAATINDAKAVIFGSVTLAYRSREAVLAAAHMARAAGVPVVFDVNLRPSIWPDLEVARARISEAIGLSSVVKLNEDERAFLFADMGDEDAAAAALAMGPDLCCLSLGEAGAYVRSPAGEARVPAFAVDVVDTTGSGDAFLAGLTLGLIEAGEPIRALAAERLVPIIAFANACGAVVATALGGMEAPLSRAAAENLVREESYRE